ncbi:MAG: cysteine desulfuration protein SufE [Rhodothalassiaceae bacterium]|nr:MAG: cysteine desulfuration protein SufE [Rhodothalassiaceae bacterium]
MDAFHPLTDETTLEDVRETFALLDAWEDRFAYLIELGRKLPPLPEEGYSEAFRVKGCTSKVWLVPERRADGRLVFRGDSDAHLVKGLVALMLLIFSGRRPEEILATDAKAILAELDLETHLSPMRANGLNAMLKRIRELAAAAEASRTAEAAG